MAQSMPSSYQMPPPPPPRRLTVLNADENPISRDQTGQIISSQRFLQTVAESATIESLYSLASSMKPQLLIVTDTFGGAAPTGAMALQQVLAHLPGAVGFIVTGQKDPAYHRHMYQYGARAVLVQGYTGLDLGNLCMQAFPEMAGGMTAPPVGVPPAPGTLYQPNAATYQTVPGRLAPGYQAASPFHPSMVTVYAGKGGVGKTGLSVNLALAVARAGISTCLVDGDIQFGGIEVVMGIDRVKYHFGEFAAFHHQVRSNAREYLTLYNPDNKLGPNPLYVLPSPANPAALDELAEDAIRGTFTCLRANFDVVVVDAGQSLNNISLIAMQEAQHVVMVGGLDVETLRKVRIVLDTLADHVPKDNFILALTMPEKDTGMDPDTAAEIIPCTVGARLPCEPLYVSAVNQRTPLYLSNPNLAYCRAVYSLAARFANLPAQTPRGRGVPRLGAAPISTMPGRQVERPGILASLFRKGRG